MMAFLAGLAVFEELFFGMGAAKTAPKGAFPGSFNAKAHTMRRP
jgi:hypothetical protein